MKFPVLVIACFAVSFTGSGVAASPTTITEADAGRSIKLRVGEDVVLNLEGNPSTGYGWFLTETNNAILSDRPGGRLRVDDRFHCPSWEGTRFSE